MQVWTRHVECVFCLFRRSTGYLRLQPRSRGFYYSAVNSRRHVERPSGEGKLEISAQASNVRQKREIAFKRFRRNGEERRGAEPKPFSKKLRWALQNLSDRTPSAGGSPKSWSLCVTQLDPEGTRWDEFTKQVQAMIDDTDLQDVPAAGRSSRPGLVDDLREESTKEKWREALERRIKFAFIDYVLQTQESKHSGADSATIDLKYPTEWYSQTRCLQREIHLHVGPTNSGKTYNALKRLEESKDGFYAGPLRLLAHEVFSRFNDRGIKCDLVTGDDVRLNKEKVDMYCSTVEMVDIGRRSKVGVIDEIQMIASEDRGWAWTRALLGARAEELHLCGEARVVPLIRELVASMGDTLHVHQYQRLNPLKVMSRSLKGNLKNLRKGDCLVSFSVVNIHALKKQIELDTGKRVAIVYGSLPPETRAQQAALFNDPNNDYDFLVASDAVGMGLNLSIKRVVFETTMRYNGSFRQRLAVPHLKQIAGRAGRYRTANDDKKRVDAQKPQSNSSTSIGLVTCLDEADLPFIQTVMNTEAPPIKAAGLLPPGEAYEDCAARFPPGVPFEYIVQYVNRVVSLNSRFTLCDTRDQLAIARVLDVVPNLTIYQRLIFCAAPAQLRGQVTRHDEILVALAQAVADRRVVTVADIAEIPLEVLDDTMSWMRHYLERLEILHKALNLFLWLHYRFPQFFSDKDMAVRAKELTEERINMVLSRYSANPKLRNRLQQIKNSSSLLRDQLPGINGTSAENSLTMNPDASVEEVDRLAREQQNLPSSEHDIVSDFIAEGDPTEKQNESVQDHL